MVKRTWPWVIGAVVVAILVSLVYGYAKARGDAAVSEAKAKAAQDQAALYAGQIKAYQDQVEKSAAAVVQIQAQAAANERLFLERLGQVRTATPQQLVDQGSVIVKATDITTDGRTVTMGVETWRSVVGMLVDDQEYRAVREPAWNAKEALYRDQIEGYKQQQIIDAKKDAGLAASFDDMKKFIAAHHSALIDLGKPIGWAERIVCAAAGYGLAKLTGKK